MPQNVFVTSATLGPDSVRHPMEFELTRSNHMENLEVPFTLTAMFKEPSPHLVPEAWRILRAVCVGYELWPAHVDQYHKKVVDKWNKGELGSQYGPPPRASIYVNRGTGAAGTRETERSSEPGSASTDAVADATQK